MNALAHCTDIMMMHILPRCRTIQTLSRLSQVNRKFWTLVMHSQDGKLVWLEMISRLTGHNAKDHISISCGDFFDRVKLLVCPWLVSPQISPLLTEIPIVEPENIRITLFGGDKGIALWDYYAAEGQFELVGVSESRPPLTDEETQERRVFDPTLPIPRPLKTPKKQFHWITQPLDRLQILTYSDDYRYFYQRIHRNAFAIIEIAAWDARLRHGIYFFSRKKDRLLRHVLLDDNIRLAPTSMIVRPMEIWMLADNSSVLYFGPSGIRLPLAVEGRMDRSLWLVGRGKAHKAMRALNDLGITDINTRSETGNMTLLHAATLHDQVQAARTLLGAKADPEARDDRGLSSVMIAALMENPDMVRLLCTEGSAQPNAVMPDTKETALHVVGHRCIMERCEETVEALLDCMADPNAEDARGQTPLFNYAILDCPLSVSLICSRGANSMHRDHAGMTPLHALFDVSHERQSAVLLVKRFGADVNAVDNNGKTPLMVAAGTRTFVDVKLLLEDLNANPLLCDHGGKDALWFARNGEDSPAQARAVIRMLEAKCSEWAKRKKSG